MGQDHQRCSIDEKRGRFSKRKKDRSNDEKPPNLMGDEEENRCRKLLVIVHFSLRPVLHLGYLTRLPSRAKSPLLPLSIVLKG